jgi:hypothetical protein
MVGTSWLVRERMFGTSWLSRSSMVGTSRGQLLEEGWLEPVGYIEAGWLDKLVG